MLDSKSICPKIIFPPQNSDPLHIPANFLSPAREKRVAEATFLIKLSQRYAIVDKVFNNEIVG